MYRTDYSRGYSPLPYKTMKHLTSTRATGHHDAVASRVQPLVIRRTSCQGSAESGTLQPMSYSRRSTPHDAMRARLESHIP